LTYLWDLDGDEIYGETGTLAVRGNEVGPSPAFVAAGLAAGQSVGVALRVIDRGGQVSDATTTVAILPLPQVRSVVVNDGSAQRSMVTSLTVTFDRVQTFLGSPTAAFALAHTGGGTVGLNVATSVVEGATVATLTFSGSSTEFGSLRDGNYTLTVFAAQLSNGLQSGDYTATLFRLLGDSDGDRDVDAQDLFRFRGSYGLASGDAGYLAYFDFDADGDVDGPDLFRFRQRFNSVLNP
jgi:hypothetical protein